MLRRERTERLKKADLVASLATTDYFRSDLFIQLLIENEMVQGPCAHLQLYMRDLDCSP
jgi:hypothetical protein